MVKYKVSKSYSETGYRCNAKYGCWAGRVKSVRVITNINCCCCNENHVSKFYLCDKHLGNIEKYIPSSINLVIKIKDLVNPLPDLFIKP